MPKTSESQPKLLGNLSTYLDLMSAQHPEQYPPYELTALKKKLKKGNCSGLTALWFYYKRRNKTPYFYNEIISPILSWDRQSNTLTPALKQKMEQGLSWLQWTQAGLSTDILNPNLLSQHEHKADVYAPVKQTDYDVLMSVVKQSDYPDLRKEYDIAFVFTNDELKDLFQKIPPNKDIRLGSGSHAIGLFFDDLLQEYTLFDPNGFLIDSNKDEEEERVFEKRFPAAQLDAVIQNIHTAFSYPPDSTMTGISIAVFDDAQKPMSVYPDKITLIKTILDNRLKKNKDTNIEATDPRNQYTALHFAAQYGHLDLIKYLISQGTTNTIQNKKKRTPLDMAASAGHLSIVQILLEHAKKTSSINTIDYTVQLHTALYYAVLGNHLPVIEFLLQENINLRNISKESAEELNVVAIAAESGNIALLEMLLKTPGGTDLIHDTSSVGGIIVSPLYCAAEYNHPKAIEILLQQGAPLHTANALNKSPLHIAAEYNNVAALKVLLQSPQANQWLDTSMYNGITPLHYAVIKGNSECVKLLLKAGANARKVTDRRNAIQIAVEKGNIKILDCLLKHDKSLLNSTTNDAETLLHLAVDANNAGSVRFLLNQGINIEGITSSDLANVLHFGAARNNVLIMNLLLQNLTSSELLDTKNAQGKTPLQIAQKYGHTDIVKLLKQAKIQTNKLQSDTQKKAKQQIKKNWIDSDYPFLVQIKTLYLLQGPKIDKLDTELMEISEYLLDLRDPITQTGLQSQLDRLEVIKESVLHIQASVHQKTEIAAQNITNSNRKDIVIGESEVLFLNILKDIDTIKNQADALKTHMLNPNIQKQKNTKPKI